MFAAGLIHALPPSERRCLDRKEAASYVNVSVGSFDKLIQEGKMPRPIQLLRRKVWDKQMIDRMIDRMSGLKPRDAADQPSDTENGESSLDAWRRANAAD
ncbi:hypothetical protein [Oricola indica]|uniref:hypothetical protein n=1 Tax=Oricola indica TaxID=2872591 RepID=UPI003CCBEAC9